MRFVASCGRAPCPGGGGLPVTPPWSIVDQYLANHTLISCEAPPGSLKTSVSSTLASSGCSPSSSHHSSQSHSASRTAAARLSSHRLDPGGDNAPSVVYCWGARSSSGGYFSHHGGYNTRFVGYCYGGSSRNSHFPVYGGPLRLPREFPIPPYVLQHQRDLTLPAPPPRVPHATALVASSLVESVTPLRSLQHPDVLPLSASSFTASSRGGSFPTPGLVGGEVRDDFVSGSGASSSTPPHPLSPRASRVFLFQCWCLQRLLRPSWGVSFQESSLLQAWFLRPWGVDFLCLLLQLHLLLVPSS